MADDKRDYYDVLGIAKGANADEIKRAYRTLAKKYHPDLNRDDPKIAEEKFKEVSEAYEVLVDDQKRKLYDAYGHQGVNQQFGNQGFTWDQFTHFSDLEDIFGDLGFFGGVDLFGRRRRSSAGPAQGEDLRYDMEMSLEDAARGVEKELPIPHSVSCKECNGSGAEKGTSPKKCPKCGGRGQVQTVRRQGYSQYVTIYPCDACGGKGTYIETQCASCKGRGAVQKIDKIQVKVPPGVDTGLRLRVQGEGEAGRRGGPSGDLYIVLHVKPHPKFQRDGDDLHYDTEVPFTTAALGGEIEVPTLEGTVRLTIPTGTQSHTIFRLGGKGMPRFGRTGRGDEYVRVKISTPKSLSDKQKELLRELAKESGEELEEKKPFFKKFKKQ